MVASRLADVSAYAHFIATGLIVMTSMRPAMVNIQDLSCLVDQAGILDSTENGFW